MGGLPAIGATFLAVFWPCGDARDQRTSRNSNRPHKTLRPNTVFGAAKMGKRRKIQEWQPMSHFDYVSGYIIIERQRFFYFPAGFAQRLLWGLNADCTGYGIRAPEATM